MSQSRYGVTTFFPPIFPAKRKEKLALLAVCSEKTASLLENVALLSASCNQNEHGEALTPGRPSDERWGSLLKSQPDSLFVMVSSAHSLSRWRRYRSYTYLVNRMLQSYED